MRPDQQHAEYPGALHAIEQADLALSVAGLSNDDIFRAELRQARDAVAEYIAANEELIAARAAPLGNPVDWMVRMDKAFERHSAAHARMKGKVE